MGTPALWNFDFNPRVFYFPIYRLRVRKKTWKSPNTIFIDKQKFDHDIPLLSSTELFVEHLDQPERVLSQTQVSGGEVHWKLDNLKVGRGW